MYGISIKEFLKDLYDEINDDNVFNGAAALSYFLMLSIFPAAIFLLTLLPYLHIPNLKEAITDLLNQVMPGQSSGLFTNIINEVVSKRRGGLLSFGFVFTLWSTSSGLAAIMQQLNITYDVKEGRSFFKVRGIAIFLTLLFFILIVGAFALVVFGGVLQDKLVSFMGLTQFFHFAFAALRWIIIAALLLMGFALIYYYGPDVEQKFRFVSPGSVLGIVLLLAASFGFRYYVNNFSNYTSTYGSLGAVIVLLLWLYIAGLVMLLGAEVNALTEHYHQSGKEKGEKELPKAKE